MAANDDRFERRQVNPDNRTETRRRAVVPWILAAGLLLVLALIFWPDRRGGVAGDYRMPDAGGAVGTELGATNGDMTALIADYVRFVTEQRAQQQVGPRHEYTAEGIRRLAAVIDAIVLRDTVAGGELEPRVRALRERADGIQRDPASDTHALQTREAFLLAASVLESVQDRRFPNLDGEARGVVDAAEGVRADRLLTDQADALQRFFDRSAHLVRAMGDRA